MVDFLVFTDRSKKVKDWIKKQDKAFAKNETAQKVVSRTIKIRATHPEYYILKVRFVSAFPSFKIPASYCLALGFVFAAIKGITSGGYFSVGLFIPAVLCSAFLMLPDLLQHPNTLFKFFSIGLRKSGYTGNCTYGGSLK